MVGESKRKSECSSNRMGKNDNENWGSSGLGRSICLATPERMGCPVFVVVCIQVFTDESRAKVKKRTREYINPVLLINA
jgi:hypothetical protein